MPPGSKTMTWVAMLVDFDKCLKITDEIKRGNSLKRKLVTGFRVDRSPPAMDEARVGIRLVSSGAQLEYEPLFLAESRKPDFVATFDKKQVAIEVTRLQLRLRMKDGEFRFLLSKATVRPISKRS